MNRILKFIKQEAKVRPGKNPLEFPLNATEICSFCHIELKKGQFTAFSKPVRFGATPEAAICQDCIKRLATMSRFADNFQIYHWKEPNYKDLKTRLLQRLYFETGSVDAKSIISDIVIHLLVRKSARMSGEKAAVCPIMKIQLAARRIALVGKEHALFQRLLEIACEEAGLGLMASSPVELASGEAYKKLLLASEATWGCHDILFCDMATKASAECNVIFACETDEGIEQGVEIIRI